MDWQLIFLQACIFLFVSSGLTLTYVLTISRAQCDARVTRRLEEITDLERQSFRGRFSLLFERWLGKTAPAFAKHLIPDNQQDRVTLSKRFQQAGIYSPMYLTGYHAAKLICMTTPVLAGLALAMTGATSLNAALVVGAVMGGCGMSIPSLWLRRATQRHHMSLRKSLPDFLDLMVACLESGMSPQAGLQRVNEELRVAHPTLNAELELVSRDIELGALLEDALLRFADRSGLEDVRWLGSFVRQTRRFGATLAEAFREHADMLRIAREHRAEEMAQKAVVKILLPTLLLIFPAIFVVVAGPAAIQLHEGLSKPTTEAKAKP